MHREAALNFDRFRVDPDDARLFRDDEPVPLTPRSFAVLCYLLRHAGKLVTKEELLRSVWDDVIVSDASLKVCVGEIRNALGDDVKNPMFVETVHRRGYRFVGKVTPATAEAKTAAQPITPVSSTHEYLVGREQELTQLWASFEAAKRGERQVIFVTGEAGSGKTFVLEEFMRRASAAGAWVSTGHCFEQFGLGEPFLPLLEAISQLCRNPQSARLIELLASHAPTWMVQLPWLQREIPQREVLGATAERMLREICDVLELLTADTPLVLVLEDLHWGDPSTVDLLPALSRRRSLARLMLIASYRPAEAILADHPLRKLKHDLVSRRLCREITINPFNEAVIDEYLARRFPESAPPAGLANRLFHLSRGNPLFLTNLIDDWLAQGKLFCRDGTWQWCDSSSSEQVPEGIRALLERRVDRLNDKERRLLDAASVAGPEFSIAAIAAALGEDILSIEGHCDDLARRHLVLESAGTIVWPDGAAAARYRFLHELYRVVLYARIPPARRSALHQAIGQRLESAYGDHSTEVAVDLARHFENGRSFARAIHYLQASAEIGTKRSANREAVDFLTRAIDLTGQLNPTERATTRLSLLERRGLVHRAGGDLTAAIADFEMQVTEARKLGNVEVEAAGLLYLASCRSWGDRTGCLAAVDESLQLQSRLPTPLLRSHVRGWAAYWSLMWRGGNPEDAQASAEAVATARACDNRLILSEHIVRSSIFCCLQSRYDDAARSATEGACLALEVGDASEYLLSHFFLAWALLHAGRWDEMIRAVQTGLETADKNGHRQWSLFLHLEQAWLHEQIGDFDFVITTCRDGLNEAERLKVGFGEAFSLILLAKAHTSLGDFAKARECFDHATQLLDAQASVLWWFERLLMYDGLTTYHLAIRDLPTACQSAQQYVELAQQSGECTYMALSQQALADAFHLQGMRNEATQALQSALTLIEGTHAPLAAWRVFETAARHSAVPENQREFQQQATNSRQSLAESLDSHPQLADIFRQRT